MGTGRLCLSAISPRQGEGLPIMRGSMGPSACPPNPPPPWLPCSSVDLTVRMQQAFQAWTRSKLGFLRARGPGQSLGKAKGECACVWGRTSSTVPTRSPGDQGPLQPLPARCSSWHHVCQAESINPRGPTCLRNQLLPLSHIQPEASGFLQGAVGTGR